MKKRGHRSVSAGFVIRALGFIPAALLTEMAAEIPHILDIYILTPRRDEYIGFRILVFIGIILAGNLAEARAEDLGEERPARYFFGMIRAALIAAAVIIFLNFAGNRFLGSTDPAFPGVLTLLSSVILGGIYAVRYVSAGRDYVREHLDELSWYPKDRENLVRYALMGRRTAQEKLPYPGEKETLRTVALEDKDPKNRAAALNKLPWPEEKETLRRAALTDEDPGGRAAAAAKLPYPEEKETLLTIAAEDKDPGNRAAALEKLPWPEERESLVRAVMQDEDRDVRWQILLKLPWPVEDKVYLSFIKDCEKTLTAVHQNKVEAEVTKAAERLMDLYRRTGSSKALLNLHEGSNPHRDSQIHGDSHEDYYPSCTEFTDYYDEHTDSSTHDDAAHDDYYIITKPGRKGR